MSRSVVAGGIMAVALLTSAIGGVGAADPRPLAVVTGGSYESIIEAADGPGAPAAAPIEFVRVNAAAAAVPTLPLDDGRYIPMPLRDFDTAVAALRGGATNLFQVTATHSNYELAIAADGSLAGTLSFEIGDLPDLARVALPLGPLAADHCLVQTAAGTGEVHVFGMEDGRVAVQLAGPGTYTCRIRLPASESGGLVRIPLVPALVTTLALQLPAGLRPIVRGDLAASAAVEPPAAAGDGWRIVVANGTELPIAIRDSRRAAPAVSSWNRVVIRGRQADVAARIVPAAGWTQAGLELGADAAVVATVVRDDSGWELPWSIADGRLTVVIPDRLIGSRMGVVATGIAPISEGEIQSVPGWRPPLGRWAGCGTEVVTDGAVAVDAIELDQCVVVTTADAADWLVPPGPAVEAGPDAADQGCRLFLEHQTPAATARIAVRPREPAFDTARVTTVDLSPGTVLGRAACDVRVVAGEVFDLTATVAGGWFIDSVEIAEWDRGVLDRGAAGGPATAVDWRVVRTPTGNELRIGLAAAATSARPLGLVITGHRPGVPLGGRFSLAELDMVRLPGESPDLALLEFRVGPMAVVETDEAPLPVEPATGRLAALAAETSPRARVPAGERAPDLTARLVRRRPPIDAEVRVSLTARDERVAETFQFTCHPVAGEIDAVVVHFSEPMLGGLEWSLIEPGSGSLAARRLDPGEAATAASIPEVGVAESWLVDVRPATAAAVRFAAARTVPLEESVPVPLAWIEAAESPGGRVMISGEAGKRPELVNRRLREVPPGAADAGAASVELSYGSPESVGGGDGPAADLLPAASAAGPRAWAWRETTVCRCHDSGMLEWESRLDVENQGRGTVNLTVPDGLRLEHVSVAGGAIAASDFGQDGGTLVVPLPAEAGRLPVVIRGTGRRDARIGWWSLGPVSCGIDLPILDRRVWLELPPGLVLAAGGGAAGESWSERLFNAVTATVGSGGNHADSLVRGVDITAWTRAGVTTAVVVRRGALATASLLVAAAAAAATWFLGGHRGPVAVIACGVAGIVALWSPTPWDGIARAAWWGGVLGTWAAARRGGSGDGPPPDLMTRAVLLLAIACLGTAAQAEADDPSAEPAPIRVIIADEPEGGMALVPERLFRRLAAAEADAGLPSIRVLDAEVIIDADRERWQLRLDLDADRGGVLRLPAAAGSTWDTADAKGEGLSAGIEIRSGQARLVTPEGGRGQVRLEFRPAFEAEAGIESAVMQLPPAATARVVCSAAATVATPNRWQCDRASLAGPWLPAAGNADGFDISRAARIRLVRPAVATDRLLSQLPVAESVNDVSWRSAECRVDASFSIGGDGEIVRRVVLRADSGLEPVLGGAAIKSLGDGRYVIDLEEPRSGRRIVAASFRMPLVDPVGLFDVPGAWLEGVGSDQRTVRLRPEPGLEAVAELPLGMTLVRPRAEDGPATAAVWRSEMLAAADRGSEDSARPRITVRRRPLPLRGSQSLNVAMAEDRIGLELDVELDAVTLPLTQIPIDLPETATIDRVVVTRRREAGESSGPDEVDAVWSQPAPGRLMIVMQRPDTGLFHLRLDARIPASPPLRGHVPLARASLDGSLPLVMSWETAPGVDLVLPGRAAPAVGEPAEEWLEIPAGESGPAYELVRAGSPAVVESAVPAESPAVAVDVGVAAAVVDLAIDHRGRGWGLARFDLVAAEPLLLVELPPGLRLFDVRVDGREVTAIPRADATWEVRLHDVTWPRTLVALFSGTVTGPLADGKPIRLVPPRIVGLPVADVIWSLDLPAGYVLRLAEPARQLDSGGWKAGAVRSRAWYGEAFQAAVAAAEPRERAWLEEFAAARREGESPAGERAWYEAWARSGAEPVARTVFAAGSDGAVTVRPVKERDGTVAGRGMASLMLAVVAVAVWVGGRRVSAVVWQGLARWWWLACGLAWLAVLEPSIPGWIMLAWGGWIALGSRSA
jgi:hypothetical protein